MNDFTKEELIEIVDATRHMRKQGIETTHDLSYHVEKKAQSMIDKYCEVNKMIITEKQILKLISIAREYQCYLGTIGFRSAKHYSQELKEFLAEIHNQQSEELKVIE